MLDDPIPESERNAGFITDRCQTNITPLTTSTSAIGMVLHC